MVNYTKLKITGDLIGALESRFIAFDTETTGLDADFCRIIEVGAVLFEKGVPVQSYGSLMRSVTRVPYDAMMVNHITNEMVQTAPKPELVYEKLIDFFGDAMRGDTIIVGHNARFDMRFLAADFLRYHYDADLLYADTCAMSRRVLPDLYSHSQDAVAHHYGIVNRQSHRATSDAETCGRILMKMLPELHTDEKLQAAEARRVERREKYVPDEASMALCQALAASVQDKLPEKATLYFQKSGKLLHVRDVQPLLTMNLGCRHPYILAERAVLEQIADTPEKLAPCNTSETKLYTDACRLVAEDQIQTFAQAVLAHKFASRDIQKLLDDQSALERWELQRESALYWQA